MPSCAPWPIHAGVFERIVKSEEITVAELTRGSG